MPDIIAVDLNMPCSPGTEIVRTLKQNAALDETAVGVCTGSLDPKDKERAHKSGADFYVVKPFDEAKLNEVQLQYAAKRPAA